VVQIVMSLAQMQEAQDCAVVKKSSQSFEVVLDDNIRGGRGILISSN
jgi:hypothetical protein